jgi:hypothetical protein
MFHENSIVDSYYGKKNISGVGFIGADQKSRI